MLSRHPRLNVEDVNGLNANRFKNNRLFSLFAQNRRHRNAQYVDHADANNYHSSLKLAWNAFCSDLFNDPAHISTWQRLSQQISKHHRSKFASTLMSKPLLDSKFKWSFNVAMHLTVRALTIKGVSPAIIAMAQTSLCQQQQRVPKPGSKGLQMDSSVRGSITVSSSKQIRDSLLPQVIRSASFPALPQRSQHARDPRLAKPLAAPTFNHRRDAFAPLHTKSLPSFSKAKRG